jgi:hypothetical protein
MATTSVGFEILDPTVQAIPDETILAKRPGDLNGKTVGLLSNGKRNADTLLDAVYALLQDIYDLKGAVRLNKGNPGRPVPEQMKDELLEKCDVIITSTGD